MSLAKLTQQQIQKLPQTLRVIIQRFDHSPKLYMQLKQMLIQSVQKIQQHSLNHDTFCSVFPNPRGLPKELLKLYGVNEREFKQAMQKIGFVPIHRMYDDIYYQTLCVAYLIGLAKDDEAVRKSALMLIDIQIWNGRKIKAFPSFCDPDVARYVMNYELKGNHTLKKAGGAFEYLDQYSIPSVDAKYAPTIADNLDSHTEGLRKLIETNYSRFVQLFASVRNAYYRVRKEGKKEIISGQYASQYGEGEMVQARESFSGNLERIVDKIQKNSMMKKNVIMSPESKKIMKDKFNVSDAGLKKINDWVMDEDNADELKYFYELTFNHLKPSNESDICKYDVPVLANKVTSAKKDKQLVKAKETLDHILSSIIGEDKFKSLGNQSLYRLRAMISYSLMINAKILLCKKV